MNQRRKFLLALGAAVLPTPPLVFAQQRPAKISRIGVLAAESAAGFANRLEALRAGLRELGYVEGRNIVIEHRFADGKSDRLTELAADLVRSRVDVIVTAGTPPTRAAKQATAAIPIVMAASGDAVATGLVATLARPGGNVTGSTFSSPELSAKRLQLLKEALPRVGQVAYLNNLGNPTTAANVKAMETAAASFKMSVRLFDVRDPAELGGIFRAMTESRVEAVAVGQDALIIANYKAIADLAAKARLPAIGPKEFADAGGVFGYGHDVLDLWRRSATYVDKILKGAKPADLPIEQPTKFELVINMKAAKALGIAIPQSILVQASRVIE